MAISRKITSSSGNELKNIPCDPDIEVNDWVFIDATDTAQKALADDWDTSIAVGVVVTKPTADSANIRVGGRVPGFTGLDPTKVYFLSETSPGDMDTTFPTGAGSVILSLGSPISETEFNINIGTPIQRA